MVNYVTLYLDESGEKAWPPPWGASAHQYYVLAGLVLTPENDLRAHREIPQIIAEFFPDLLSRPPELHYGDLINKRRTYALLSDEQRIAMANRVWELIISLQPVLLGSVVKKALMKSRYAEKAHPPNEYAMRATIDRFDRHLGETDQIGMAIMDTESLSSDQALREIVHNARWSGIRVGVVRPGSERRLEHVLNSVTFSPSQMSPGIQLADFVAYATFSHFERGKSRRFEQISNLWRRVGSFQEPSIIPKDK